MQNQHSRHIEVAQFRIIPGFGHFLSHEQLETGQMFISLK